MSKSVIEQIQDINLVIEKTIRGELNERIKGLDSLDPQVSELAYSINYMLDKMEIFLVEARVALEDHASGTGKRRIDSRGFDLEFLRSLNSFNQALDNSNEQKLKIIESEKESRRQAEAAARLGCMIQGAKTYFMTCDENFIVTSVNPSLLEMFKKYEPIINKVFKGFSANDLIGNCIDIFHKTPSWQRNLLKNLGSGSATAQIKFGGLEFTVTAVRLIAPDGKCIGYGAEWKDDNDLARYRKEVGRVIASSKDGDLKVRGDLNVVSKEYAPMLLGINEIINAIVEPIIEIQEKLNRIKQGDLTAYVNGEYKGDHNLLKTSLNDTLDSLNQMMNKINNSADQVSRSAKEISSAAQSIANVVTEQAASMAEMTSSMGEIASQTNENAKGTLTTKNLIVDIQNSAQNGKDLMIQMQTAMDNIGAASSNIFKIIKVIDEIAAQTNLLAINAAVEAARAGVHGKGFAVVAEEVRNLATRSTKATQETTELIQTSFSRVKDGTNLTEKTRNALNIIVEKIEDASKLINKISKASDVQAQQTSEVSSGLNQLDQVIQQNSAISEECASASNELNHQGEFLLEQLAKFKIKEMNNDDDVIKMINQLPKDMLEKIMSMAISTSK